MPTLAAGLSLPSRTKPIQPPCGGLGPRSGHCLHLSVKAPLIPAQLRPAIFLPLAKPDCCSVPRISGPQLPLYVPRAAPRS